MRSPDPVGYCANHPREAALTRCNSCSRRLCTTCWRTNVDAKPWCEACVVELEKAGHRRAALAATFVALCALSVVIGVRMEQRLSGEASPEIWIAVGIGALVGAAAIVLRKARGAHGRRIEPRAPETTPELTLDARAGHPYRTRVRRAVRALAPPLSGRSATLLLGGCMLATALLVPNSLDLPRFGEVWLTLSSWWLIWLVSLSVLLYRGFRLSDDHVLRVEAFDFGATRSARSSSGPKWHRGCSDPGCSDVEGCAGLLAGLVIVGFALLLAWLLVEFVVPAVFFAVYFLLRGSLARVANDDHDCEGRLPRALLWGGLWATLYALPLAAVVALVELWLVAR